MEKRLEVPRNWKKRFPAKTRIIFSREQKHGLPANLLSRHPAIFQFYVRETERSESLR
jgi:hypothetical protein